MTDLTCSVCDTPAPARNINYQHQQQYPGMSPSTPCHFRVGMTFRNTPLSFGFPFTHRVNIDHSSKGRLLFTPHQQQSGRLVGDANRGCVERRLSRGDSADGVSCDWFSRG
eukprot:891740-Pyramimonas_sp.AAC.1